MSFALQLPHTTHVVLCVAKCLSIYDVIFRRFTKLLTQCMNSDFSLPFLIMYNMNHCLWHTPLLVIISCTVILILGY